MGKDYVKINRNLICKECGDSSQRWGKCWENKLCAKCFKNRYISCKECGATSCHYDRDNWKEELCGLCFKRKNNPKRFKQYHICKCGTRLNMLHYWKNNKLFNTSNRICTKCSIIYIGRNKYKLASILS